MIKTAKFPIILLSLFILAGIVLQNIIQFSFSFLGIGFSIALVVLYLFHRITNQKITYFYPYNIAFAITALWAGMFTGYFGDARHNNRHYTHFIQADSTQLYQIRVDKQLKTTAFYYNYIGTVIQINEQKTKGKILIKQSASEVAFATNTLVEMLGNGKDLRDIPHAKNPFGFDYAQYMNKKQVYKQLSLKNKAFKTSFESGLSINAIAESWRNRIKQIFIEAKLKPKELALANAIFLGERQYLSKETLQNFQASGTIHILAISGLHIGILLIFLNFIFAFVKRYIGVLPFIIITLSLLWLYAMMTGFSPSVTRAVTMFSFLQIGLQLKRSTNIYNTIFASALLMMLVNPNVIYQVGFQMSYAAVLSIVSFFPIIIKYFTVRHKIAQWFIDLLVVSASAQLGVLPFSLYYFHQFPVYFFLANLLVIPLLFLLLFYGFSYILIALTGFIIPKSDWLFEQILSIILGINKHIAGFESALLTQIRFSLPQLVISIALIMIFYHLLKKEQKIKYAYLFLLTILLFQAEILFEKHRKSKQNEYYIFQQYKTSVVGENSGENFVFYQTKDRINPYLLKGVSLQFNHISFDTISFVRKTHQKTILHIDSLGIFQYQNLKADIIHLQYSPKINLDRAISILKPKIIVADGSNYVSYIKQWQNSAKNANVLFYNTNNEGAFILK